MSPRGGRSIALADSSSPAALHSAVAGQGVARVQKEIKGCCSPSSAGDYLAPNCQLITIWSGLSPFFFFFLELCYLNLSISTFFFFLFSTSKSILVLLYIGWLNCSYLGQLNVIFKTEKCQAPSSCMKSVREVMLLPLF